MALIPDQLKSKVKIEIENCFVMLHAGLRICSYVEVSMSINVYILCLQVCSNMKEL